MLFRNLILATVLSVSALIVPVQAQSLNWGPGGLGGTGTWDNATSANWNDGVSDVVWTGGNLAVFGGTAGTVTVSGAIPGVNGMTFNTTGYTITGGTSLTLTAANFTLGAGITASVATPLAGNVGLNLTGGGNLLLTNTLAGANTLTGTYTVGTGSTLTMSGELLAATGNAFTVNGTLALTLSATAGSGRYINDLQGSGTLTNAGAGTTPVTYRVKLGNFSGSITNGLTAPTAVVFEATAGLLTLSGTNTYTGDTLVRNNGILRPTVAAALPTNSLLRMAGGTLELTPAFGDFARPLSAATGTNAIAFEAGNSYFSAVGGDRSVTIGTAGSTLTWGTAPFAPGTIGIGSANGTGKVTWNNAFNGGAAARTLDVQNSPAAIDAEFTGAWTNFGALTKAGPGTVLFSAGLSAAGYRFKAGTIILNNTGTNNITAFSSIGLAGGDFATLNILGATNVTHGNFDFNVSDVTNTRGELNINTTGTVTVAGVTWVGKTNAVGVINMIAGTYTGSNTFRIGNAGTSVGVINLSGGTFSNTGGGEGRYGGYDTGNTAAYAFLNVTGGTLNSTPAFQIGAFGLGVMNQTGGVVNTSSWTDAGRFNTGNGTINLSGGQFNQNGAGNRLFAGEDGIGVINVSGTAQVLSAGGITIGNTATAVGTFNMLGGTLTTQYFNRANGTGRLYLNGGTVKPRAANATWINGSLTSTTIGPVATTIDTNNFDVGISQALLAPTGSGVMTIPVLTGGSGYFGPPVVTITGDGTGATASAVVVNGVVTAINITNPGNDYLTAPTVALLGGGVGNGAPTLAPVVAATLGTPTIALNAVDGGLIKTGTGVLTLSGANTFTGPLVISGGVLAVPTMNDNSVAGPLGAQPTAAGLRFNGGTLRYTGPSASSTRTFSIAPGQQAIIDVSTAATNLTLNGAAPTTSEGITKTGLGVLSLNFSTPADYTGLTRVNAGILSMTGTVSTTIQVNAGRLNAGYQSVDTTLTVPALNLTTGSGVDFDFDAGHDTISVASVGGLTLSSTTLNLYQSGSTTPFTTNGTYSLFNYNTSFTGSLFGAFSVANSQPGKVYSITSTASTIDLTIADAVTTAWATDGSGSWAFAGNWTSGVPNSNGAVATFGNVITSPVTVTVDGPKTVGNLIFDNAVSYSVTGSAADIITINNGIGAPLISAVQGSHSVSAPIVLLNPTNLNAGAGAVLNLNGPVSGAGSITKVGPGTIVLAGANSYSGSTLIAAGTLEVANAAALNGSPNLTIRDGATLRVSSAATNYSGPVVLDLFGGTVVNISGAENGTGNYIIDVPGGGALSVGGLFNNTGGSLVIRGAGSLTLTNPGANVLAAGATGIGLSVQGGTLTLNGGAAATYASAGELAVGDNTLVAGTLNVISGALNVGAFLSVSRGNGTTGLVSSVNLSGGSITAQNFFTGFANGVAGYNATSQVSISNNAVLTATNNSRLAESVGSFATVAMAGTSTYFVQNNFEVGFGGNAVISVGSGTTLNVNQLFLGASGGSGAVYNRGTTIVRSGASTNHFAIGNSTNGYGYFLNDTPTTTALQEIGVGGAGGGSGILEIRSGTITIGQWVTINRTNAANATSASLIVNGGTLVPNNLAGRFYVNQNVANNQYGTIEVIGTGRIAGGNVQDINLNNNSLASATTTLTLSAGGTIETTRIFAAQAIGNVFVNFNGGTLKPTANNAALLDTNLDAVVIHEGGLTVDTNGLNATLGGNALLAPVSLGITSIPVINGGTRYIGRPIVQITDGTGTGASAIANFNESTGVVTGITITSPGSNYSFPTVTLVGGGATIPATLDLPVLTAATVFGGLTKTGAGTLTLSNGNSTYLGATTINGGTLLVTNTTGSATSTGNVNVNNGGTLSGNGIITGTAIVASGGSVAPGNAGVGNLTVGGLTLNAGSIINHQITDALTLDLLTVTNFDGLTINGGGYNVLQTLNGNPFSTNGVYNLISYQGSILGAGTAALSVLNAQPGKTYNFGSSGGFVTLTIATAGGVPNFWNVDADGNWTVGGNWTLGAPNGVSAFANFGGGGTPISSPRTVTLNANQTVGAISFNSPVAFTLAGTNTLTLNNGVDPNAQVTVTLGNHAIGFNMNVVSPNLQVNVLNAADSLIISGNLSGTTNVSKLGSGLLTLSGTNSVNGPLTIASGTVESSASAALGFSSVTLANGTTLRLSGATNTIAPPVNMAIGGGTPTGMSGLENGTANFTINVPGGTAATISGLITNASGSFVKTGSGSLSLTNSGTNTLANVGGLAATVQDGSLTLNDGSFSVTGEFTVGDNTPNAVTLTVAGGSLNVSSYLSIGRGNGTTGLVSSLNVTGGSVNTQFLYTGYNNNVGGYNAVPNINISNGASVTATNGTRLAESPGAISTMTLTGAATLATANDTQVGFGGIGILNISDTATLSTGSFGIGNGNNGAGNTGAGVVNQTGGAFLQNGGGGAGDLRIGGFNPNDAAVYGAYKLNAGLFNTGGRNFQIGAYGTGILEINGGDWTSTGGFPVVGRFTGGNGLLTITSGSINQQGTGNLLIIGEAGNGVMNIQGGTVTLLANPGGAGNAGGTGGLRLGHVSGGNGSVNLNGGTLTTTGIAKSNAAGIGNLYLNGGILRAGAANTTFLQGLDSVVVGPGGANIDTNGNSITINQSMTAPQGQGITAIPVLSGGAGYIGQPLVQISGGGGTGATAIAIVSGGVVTGFTITNPGNGYFFPPTITLVGGAPTTPAVTDDPNVVLANNPTTGGLTKTGTGTLTLGSANFYGGPTTVSAGTLLVANTVGSATANGNVTVATAGTLRGTGIISGPVTVNGTIRGGASIGTLTLESGMTVNSGGRIYVEIADGSTNAAPGTGGSTIGGTPNPTSNNFLNILSGTTSISGGTLITIDGSAASFAGGQYSYKIASGAGDQSGLNITNPSQFTFVGILASPIGTSLTGNAAGDVFVNFSTIIPEPSLMLVAVFGLAALRRRGKR